VAEDKLFMRALLHVLRDNVAVVISCCSLLVAMASFVLTWIIQNRDAYYKELSITPHLAFSIGGDFTYKVRNTGLGPAVIKDWVIKFDDQCYKLLQPPSDETAALLNKRLLDHMFTKVFKGVPLARPVTERIIIDFAIYQPGIYIEKGQEISIISMPDEFRTVLQETLSKLPMAQANELLTKFNHAVWSLPLTINYCSISGYTCTHRVLPECP